MNTKLPGTNLRLRPTSHGLRPSTTVKIIVWRWWALTARKRPGSFLMFLKEPPWTEDVFRSSGLVDSSICPLWSPGPMEGEWVKFIPRNAKMRYPQEGSRNPRYWALESPWCERCSAWWYWPQRAMCRCLRHQALQWRSSPSRYFLRP